MVEQKHAPQIDKKEENAQPVEEGQVTWGEYWDMVRMCSDRVSKAKAQMELGLARDAKNNKSKDIS